MFAEFLQYITLAFGAIAASPFCKRHPKFGSKRLNSFNTGDAETPKA
jgi:hypothetical protein